MRLLNNEDMLLIVLLTFRELTHSTLTVTLILCHPSIPLLTFCKVGVLRYWHIYHPWPWGCNQSRPDHMQYAQYQYLARYSNFISILFCKSEATIR